jgi:nucleotide-binding universal stress UspA family protein
VSYVVRSHLNQRQSTTKHLSASLAVAESIIMFKRILIATDGSRLSRKAIKHGVTLATSLGASVVGFHNWIPFRTIHYGEEVILSPSLQSQYDRQQEKLGTQYLGEIEAHTLRAGVGYTAIQSSMAVTSDEIIRIAKKNKCDLIVMASHGRRGLARVIVGSETNHVLTRTTIPVLIVR